MQYIFFNIIYIYIILFHIYVNIYYLLHKKMVNHTQQETC